MLLRISLFFMGAWALAAAADSGREAALRTALAAAFPDAEVARLGPSPVPGLYEALVGTEVFYLSEDGRYILQGDLIDLSARINISEEQRAAARVGLLAGVPMTETINFAPASASVRHTAYVFTDITCGYCRRFHQDVPELNELGIAVRYLAFPRAGVGSAAFEDMESVWCAADPQDAMTRAKTGRQVAPAACDNPVKRQYQLGESLGVRGTPAIYLDSGRYLPGYVPPETLLQAFSEQ